VAVVIIAPYDPAWPAMFQAERALIEGQLGAYVVGAIEHVGSTAVPGLSAKPVIDIMVGVASLELSRPALPLLEPLGYCHFPYKADVMHWLCKPSPELRTHHAHLVPFQSRLWIDRLAFRDSLRADAALRAAYARLKIELAVRYREDREAYTEHKTDFIQRVLAGAVG
jgi:GrpB-like predicted nucleotidyltransferase (UPF0157 family)